MSGEFDWLEGHEDKPIAVRPAGTVEQQVPTEKRQKRPAALVRADRKLSLQQRVYRDCVVSTGSIREANERYRESGLEPSSAEALRRWRKKPEFVKAKQLAEEYLGQCLGVTRDGLVHRLEQIRDKAMEPVPKLWKGRPTGYTEYDPNSALKAIEQTAKLAGLYGEEQKAATFTLRLDFGSYGDPEPIDGEFSVVEE